VELQAAISVRYSKLLAQLKTHNLNCSPAGPPRNALVDRKSFATFVLDLDTGNPKPR